MEKRRTNCASTFSEMKVEYGVRFAVKSSRVLLDLRLGKRNFVPALVVVNTESGTFERIVLPEQEELYLQEKRNDDLRVLDVGDDMVLPGLVDVGYHFFSRERDCEDVSSRNIEEQTIAAAAGGITTLVDAPKDALPSKLSHTLTKNMIQKMRSAQPYVNIGTLTRIDLSSGFEATGLRKTKQMGSLGCVIHSSNIRSHSAAFRQLCKTCKENNVKVVVELNKAGRIVEKVGYSRRNTEWNENCHLSVNTVSSLDNSDYDGPHFSDHDESDDEISSSFEQANIDSPWSQRSALTSFNSPSSQGSRLSRKLSNQEDMDNKVQDSKIRHDLQDFHRRCLVESIKRYFAASRSQDSNESASVDSRNNSTRSVRTQPFQPVQVRKPSSLEELLKPADPNGDSLLGNRVRSGSISSISSARSIRTLRRQRRNSVSSVQSWRLDRDEPCTSEFEDGMEQGKTPVSLSRRHSGSFSSDCQEASLGLDYSNSPGLTGPNSPRSTVWSDGIGKSFSTPQVAPPPSKCPCLPPLGPSSHNNTQASKPIEQRRFSAFSAHKGNSHKDQCEGLESCRLRQRARGGSFDKALTSNRLFVPRATNSFESGRGVLSQALAAQHNGSSRVDFSSIRISSRENGLSSSSSGPILLSGSSSRAPVKACGISTQSSGVVGKMTSVLMEDLLQFHDQLPQVLVVCGGHSNEELDQFQLAIQAENMSTITANDQSPLFSSKCFGPTQRTVLDLFQTANNNILSFESLLDQHTVVPVTFLGLNKRKGFISSGFDADFVIFSTKAEPFVRETFCGGLSVLRHLSAGSEPILSSEHSTHRCATFLAPSL